MLFRFVRSKQNHSYSVDNISGVLFLSCLWVVLCCKHLSYHGRLGGDTKDLMITIMIELELYEDHRSEGVST